METTFACHVQPDVVQIYLTAPEGSKNASCIAEMLDSQNELTDSRMIVFSVNATVTDSLSVSDGTRESLTGGDSNAMTCTQRCGNAFALICFYLKGCNAELAKAIGLIVFLIFVGTHLKHNLCKSQSSPTRTPVQMSVFTPLRLEDVQVLVRCKCSMCLTPLCAMQC